MQVATVAEIVHAIGLQVPRAIERLSWRPEENIQRLFGAMPASQTPRARAIGFADDGDIEGLLVKALQA